MSSASSKAQTRAFLFADLRGYSAYTDRHGDDAARLLIRRFRELVRSEIDAHDGAEIRTEGDSFYVVFDSISDAVLAGLSIQDAARSAASEPDSVPLRIGIGIHAGEVMDGAEGIVSSAVNTAARVCAIAEPGEVLVTDTVRSLTRTLLPNGFTPRGRRRLKGIAEPVALFAVRPSASEDRLLHTRSRRPRFAVLGAFVAGVVVIVGVALSVRGPAPSGGAETTPSASTTATEPEETHDLGRFNDPGEYPNGSETALLDQLPSATTSTCERADPSTYPVTYIAPEDAGVYAAGTYTAVVRAGVTCLTGGNRATYHQLGRRGAGFALDSALEIFHNGVFRRSLTEGSCEESTRAYAEWTSGGHTGHVMCFMRDGEAVLEWTYLDPNIYAIAARRDGDLAALYAWWEDVGRRLSR